MIFGVSPDASEQLTFGAKIGLGTLILKEARIVFCKALKSSMLFVILLLPLEECKHVTQNQTEVPPKMIKVETAAEMERNIGKQVVIVATALDAKAGAILDLGDDIIYVSGLRWWPRAVTGKKGRATGTLVKEKYIPDPVTDEGRAVGAGSYGLQYLLKDPHWAIESNQDR